MTLLASFIQEHPTVGFNQLPAALESWAWVFGVISIVILMIWGGVVFTLWLQGRGGELAYGISGRLAATREGQEWKHRTFWFLIFVTALGLVATGLVFAFANQQDEPEKWYRYGLHVLTIPCVAALLAVSWEFLLGLGLLSGRRIWALARFSIKEAIRRKTLWSFCLILLIFLFASWFMPLYQRPQDQWRNYVDLVFFVTSALLLVTTSVLACFSLPADIRSQSIHTIVTKPVQKFEIILGRILGFGLLMTIVLFVMAHASMAYVMRGVDADARQTTMRARVPVFAPMIFEELDAQGRWAPRAGGENVGREWEYRTHLRGGSTQEAVWRFTRPPGSLQRMERIPVEFTFDIFRTNKGGEQYREGVLCQFSVVNKSKWDYSQLTEYREAKDPETGLPMNEQERARKYGYYELPSPKNVYDYQTMSIEFPSTVLEGLGNAPLEVRVNCRSHGQYLGAAQPDLYILAAEGNFYLNFLKGTTGIWFLMMLIVTLGVVFSTYLSALVGLMSTWLFFICGFPRLREYITGLASPVDTAWNPGGGPGEAFIRLIRGENMVSPLEKSTSVETLKAIDWGFRGLFWAFLRILPDLGQYERSMWVAEGFNIPAGDLLASVVLLAIYIFPFLLAGYYLINVREVAQ